MALRISARNGQVLVDVHVVPRATRSEIVGVHDGCLKVALSAPPVEGEANRALIDLFAKLLGRPRREVTLVRGASSRRKTVAITGVAVADVEALAARALL